MKEQFDQLYKVRHSLAHIMAQAVLQLRPNSKLGFGPPIDTGFYYDFLFDTPVTEEDFAEIEKRMRKIIAERQEFSQKSRPGQDAIEYLNSRGEPFKAEYCRELLAGGESEIGFFINGPFEDMCKGPHVKHTGEVPPDSFKLDSIAGAYWRGDEKNVQMTRLYALAFENKKALEDFIHKRELAKQRDHRKLGKELELYTIVDEVGPGLPLWLPNGTILREELEKYAKEMEIKAGYQRVATPHLAKEGLYYQSGHLPYYKDTMFPPMVLEGESNYYLKAMNCPHHHMVYKFRPRSYRELPLKLAEYGTVYRFEPSGTLAGLLRVRSLAMNDAHIYCTLEQLKEQLRETAQMAFDYYNLFRFENIKVRVSLHDPKNKEKYIGTPDVWAFAEKVLKEVVLELGVQSEEGMGEAAFYGPKLDFQLSTALGREETLGTTQLDFAAADRFGLTYTAEDGKEHKLYVVHRAPLSTHERFFAFLIEHLGGAFPTWLAPIQVRIVPVADKFNDYVASLESALKNELIRVEVDRSSDSFNKKIRNAVTHKIPNIFIVGGKEAESGSITLRRYCVEKQQTVPKDVAIDRLKRLVAQRAMDNFPDVDL